MERVITHDLLMPLSGIINPTMIDLTTDLIAKCIETHMTPSALTSVEFLQTLVENSFMAAAGVFTAFFMLVVSVFLFKGLRKLDLKGLFLDNPTDKHISNSKFWSNVAYFVSTVAFLAINLAAPGAQSLEFIWVVYLGVVASAAVASKFLSLRYSAAGQLTHQQEMEHDYSSGRRRWSRRTDRRGDEDEGDIDYSRDLPPGYSDR